MRTEFIFETAPFAQCHASTIAETKAGLIAAWFGGKREGDTSVGIWLSRHDGKWSPPVEVANGNQPDGSRLPCWNPVLFQPREGPLLLFYKVGPSPSTWWCERITSTDAGKTWSKPERHPDGSLGPIKSKPIQLSNGDILCPSSTESRERPSQWRLVFECTGDLGKTWSKSSPPEGEKPIQAIQPNLLVHKDGKLQAIGRSRSGKLFSVVSKDEGKTWSPVSLLDLPNPNSGTDAGTLKDGRHLLVYNHTAAGRSPLNAAVSDDGIRWNAALVLENTPGEYSYPSFLQTSDGLVHITYTWKRQRVKHVVVDPAKLVTREIKDGVWPR
jgi:predicted neuraminidase